MSRKPLTDEDGEVRELDEVDLAEMKPFDQVLPADLVGTIKRRPGQRGPGRSPPKKLVTLRVDAEVLERYRSTGSGWQTRMAAALRDGMPKTS